MTVREKIEELVAEGVKEFNLYAEASNMELPMTDANLDTELVDCDVTGDTADLYI
jgi:hypothetical protein